MNYQKLINNIQKSGNEFQLRRELAVFLDERIKNLDIEGKWEEKRMDLYYPNVVIETKAFKKLNNNKNLEKAKEQIKRYMKQNLIKYGCLVDGYKIYFFELKKDKENKIIINEINTNYSNNFNEANLEFLLNLIINNNILYLNPYNLITLFGNLENNQFMQEILEEFLIFFQKNESIKKDMLFKEWDKLFKISEEGNQNKEEVINRRVSLSRIFKIEISNTNEESKALFILHNVLSIIVKLLIYNNFSKIGLIEKINIQNFHNNISNLKSFMSNLENGIPFYQIGVYNLIIYDYFSWYSDNQMKWNNKFANLLIKLIEKINLIIPIKENIETIDYMEELYRKFIPKEIRHSFGEFFTPTNIAELSVKKIAGIEPYDKIIDPTCGSGTFLIQSIKVKKENNLSLLEILNSITGIDLNPINVLLSKFNIVSNLLEKIEEVKESDIVIPIFIGDSSYVPQIVEVDDDIKIIQYKWLTNIRELDEKIPDIVFPLKFVKNKKFFSIMQIIKENIENNKDIKEIKKYLNQELQKLNIKVNETIKIQLETLIEFIYDYHKTNMNSIWLFIFISYIYPFATAPYDKVVGNPPWVRWSNLPSFYKEKIKSSLREKGLFSSDSNTGGIDLNIYGLITYNSLVFLLKEEGYLIFLLPASSLQNKSLEGFRYLSFHKYGEIIEPIYFSKGKIFEEVDLDFIIIKIKKRK
jgi:hypothetical protein